MQGIIAAALTYSRTTLLLAVMLFLVGIGSYIAIPKESSPDIPIPTIYVSLKYDGISPEDAVDLLIKPMEQELKTIDGLDELQSQAYQSGGSIVLQFNAGFDNKKALDDVRAKVDVAKAKLPRGAQAEEPKITEINIATFPILTVILRGDVSQRTLKATADDLQDKLETIPGVLEAKVLGTREDQVLIDIDRQKLESYGLSPEQIFNAIDRNNTLVAAGSLRTGSGEFAVKVPGLFKSRDDVLNLPIYADGDRTIRVRDIADVKLVFKDPNVITRVNGQPAVTLEISKRIGENVIETVDAVKAAVTAAQQSANWPKAIAVEYTSDESDSIRTMLLDLQNNVLMAVILVMALVVVMLGNRASFLIALSLPGAFFFGVILLYALGMTMNIVVLFSLILAVGMLVDAATVVVELADRNLAKGMGRKEAYHKAAIAMAWPMTASTLAIIVVFLPLLFWPGIVGEFMKYLPITLILTLAGSLVMAFTVIPVVGAYIGGPNPAPAAWENSVTRWYLKLLGTAIARPMRSLVIGSGVFFGGAVIYFALGYGTQFFPSIDAERADIVVRAKGDFSVEEKDRIVAQVEERIIGTPGVKTVYARSGNLGSRRGGGAQDVVGRIFIEFEKWEVRRTKSDVIMADILKRVGPINGVIVQAEGERQGPAQGKPIRIGVLADNFATAAPVARVLTEKLKAMPGTRNVTNSLPDPGIEWNMVVDRDEAARAGTSLGVVGATLQLGTTGMIVGNYRPDDQEEEIDIVARFKPDERNTNTLDDLRVPTPNGAIPIANLAKREAQPKVTMIERLDQKTVVYVEGDTAKGVLANTILAQVKAGLATTELPKGVSIRLLGDEKDQKETGRFLAMAFVIALFAMVLVFVTQFNSISQAMIVMSAVAFSTAGVFIGHLILGQPFGIVMSGLGVIALAGIIVNNNVVLIDTYNELRAEGLAWREALLKTCETRWRPVFLTAATTVVGLIPMGMRLNIDLLNRSVVYDAPSTQWWDQLSNAIMFGCTFATVLTLVLTPCMLAWVELRKERKILGLQAANTPAPQGKTLPKVQVTVTRPGKNKR